MGFVLCTITARRNNRIINFFIGRTENVLILREILDCITPVSP